MTVDSEEYMIGILFWHIIIFTEHLSSRVPSVPSHRLRTFRLVRPMGPVRQSHRLLQNIWVSKIPEIPVPSHRLPERINRWRPSRRPSCCQGLQIQRQNRQASWWLLQTT